MTTTKDARPRIGLDLLFVRPGRIGGGETYARGLVEGLRSLDLPFHFILFLNRDAYPTFPDVDAETNFERVLCPVPVNASLRHIWTQLRMKSYCRQYRLDLLHSLGNVIPFNAPCPTTVTIHDMLYKVRPEAVPFKTRELVGRLITRSARKSDRIITVSHASEADIVRYLGVPPEKVHVTPEGPGQTLQVAAPWEEVQRRYNVPKEYFLTVGATAHKRLDRIVQAVGLLRSQKDYTAEVIVTNPMGNALPKGLGSVRHYGFVPADDLASLYQHAIALICFSDMEGFGLTALEAMNLGTPVVASNAAALPEVLGDGGIIVEHGDPAALADAMWRIATDRQLHSEMRERGYKRVAHFSWMACAAETARAYEMLLK
jgi:glycosyltransferase involved in cell wall biosynthesis